MAEYLTENTVPVLGEFYMVPCAKRKHHGGKVDYIPVIGNEHSDPQLGFSMKHFHIDCRFIKRASTFDITKDGKTSAAINTEYKFPFIRFLGIVYQKRKCVRLTTGLNITPSGYEIYGNFYAKYLGKSCKGKRCPHLGTTMHECDGVLRCPLHDLIGDLKTETIIPHSF